MRRAEQRSAPSASGSWRGRASALISAAGTIVLAVLVPKCPLCIVAMLSALGIGASAAATLAPAVKPLVYTLTTSALVAFVAFAVRRARSRKRRSTPGPHCCSAKPA